MLSEIRARCLSSLKPQLLLVPFLVCSWFEYLVEKEKITKDVWLRRQRFCSYWLYKWASSSLVTHEHVQSQHTRIQQCPNVNCSFLQIVQIFKKRSIMIKFRDHRYLCSGHTAVVSPYSRFQRAYCARVWGLTLFLIRFRDSIKSEKQMFLISLAAMFLTCSGRSSRMGPSAASLAKEVRSLPE